MVSQRQHHINQNTVISLQTRKRETVLAAEECQIYTWETTRFYSGVKTGALDEPDHLATMEY
jgi:hypothetical protein